MWPYDVSEWISQDTYKFIENLIWIENGKGNIIHLIK